MEKYNGWTNYETWNVNLWFNNDEGLYTAKKEARVGYWTPAQVEGFCREMMPNGTPDFDSVNDYKAVDWQEIAEAWNEE